MDDYHLYLIALLLVSSLIIVLFFFFFKKLPERFNTSVVNADIADIKTFSGHLGEEEQALIENIREFQDGIVREVMIPRIDIVAIEETATLEFFRQLAVIKGHSRIPVYRETIDHVIGVAYVKDMLRYWDSDDTKIIVSEFMRPPYFIPETKNIGALLHEFQVKKVHIAVAIDEYGGTAGLVTIEDLLEVVFGDIVDEHDAEEDLIKVINEQTLEANAKVGIDELEAYVGELVIEQQDFETIGGLLFSILGDVPKPGDIVTYQHLKFTILHADRHRIVTVRVEWSPEPSDISVAPYS